MGMGRYGMDWVDWLEYGKAVIGCYGNGKDFAGLFCFFLFSLFSFFFFLFSFFFFPFLF